LFGVSDDDCFGIIDFDAGKAHLFVNKLNNLYKIWQTVLTKEDFQSKYEIETHYSEDLDSWLSNYGPSTIHLVAGENSDSGF
jgi:hypothetical protein